jgi:hypothetical protein
MRREHSPGKHAFDLPRSFDSFRKLSHKLRESMQRRFGSSAIWSGRNPVQLRVTHPSLGS